MSCFCADGNLNGPGRGQAHPVTAVDLEDEVVVAGVVEVLDVVLREVVDGVVDVVRLRILVSRF